MRFATDEEIAKWNELILKNPDDGNVFQGREFAEQKQMTGWTPLYATNGKLAITLLEKHVFGLGKLWYLPKGPGIVSADELPGVLAGLRKLAQQYDVFGIKIEPELPKKATFALIKQGLRSVAPIQPNFSTITVDISSDLDTVLARLNQKGRHAIRRAERDGVRVKRVKSSDDNCQAFYDLLAATASGAFSIRSYDYYKTFWQRYADAGIGQLFFAYVDGKVVAGAYAIVFGTKSTYKDGASVRERTVYGASHLLQWHVIKWAKEHGSQIHDLCGSPPSDQINNPEHKHYGIGRFKTSFNKEVTDYVGAFDLAVNPLPYVIWSKIGERLVLRAYWRKHRESWY